MRPLVKGGQGHSDDDVMAAMTMLVFALGWLAFVGLVALAVVLF